MKLIVAVWAFKLVERVVEVPMDRIHSLHIMLSGVTLTKSHVRIFPVNSLLVLEIGYYSGIVLRGFFVGLDPMDTINEFREILQQAGRQITYGHEMPNFWSGVVLRLYSLSLAFSSNENLLNLLEVNLEQAEE